MCKFFYYCAWCTIMHNFVDFDIPFCMCTKNVEICIIWTCIQVPKSAHICSILHSNPCAYAEICIQIPIFIWINANRCQIMHWNADFCTQICAIMQILHLNLHNYAEICIHTCTFFNAQICNCIKSAHYHSASARWKNLPSKKLELLLTGTCQTHR